MQGEAKSPWLNARQPVFHLAATVDRMSIPDHANRSFDLMQQVPQKSDYFVPTDRSPMRLQVQLDLASRRRHTQGTDQVQALIVFQTGAQGGRLPTRSPSPLQRRDQ